MFNDTVTFYNYGEDTESWKRTVIKGCQWSAETVKTVSADGKLNISKVVNITIPIERAVMPEKYVDYRLYNAQTVRDGLFTINPTTNMDVAVLGECDADITAEYTLSQLVREHVAATVSSVTDNTLRPRLRNIKVVAR
nr:MAG TPA: hypothetical protein [Caudoviricetes sp.]